MFYHLERPNEVETRNRSLEIINKEKDAFLDRLWKIPTDNTTAWDMEAYENVNNITKVLIDAFETHYIEAAHLNDTIGRDTWTFAAAVFFASTLLTTIGKATLADRKLTIRC